VRLLPESERVVSLPANGQPQPRATGIRTGGSGRRSRTRPARRSRRKGQVAAEGDTPLEPRLMGSAAGSARPPRSAAGAGRGASAPARADPLRADVRLAACLHRGAAYLMASDLAGSPQSGIRVQRCGDAHLANFGAFASPERQLLFDLNDFDETLPGPWEWDVKRLAASVAVVGRENGFAAKRRTAMVRELVDEYRRAFERSPGSFRRRKRRARYSSLSPPSLGSRIRGSVWSRDSA
jgi:hypothetical protein